MRWQGRSGSSNVEDRRAQRSGFRGRGVKGPTSILLLLVVMAAGYYGVDLSGLLSDGGGLSPAGSSMDQPYTPTAEEEELAQFTSVALKTTEEAWGALFQQMGRNYQPPRLVLYTGTTSTTCGYGQAGMGPFYCPGDQTVYIDLSFYQDMKNQLGGGGDFAQGYVIAHEVGHHVQNLLGLERQIRRRQEGAGQREANQLSVSLELQADCFAGVWGRTVDREGLLEPGDVEEALRTAEAIGDDRLQRQSTGQVVPDSFTHGTSAQRYEWFQKGFDSGDPQVCYILTGNQ